MSELSRTRTAWMIACLVLILGPKLAHLQNGTS